MEERLTNRTMHLVLQVLAVGHTLQRPQGDMSVRGSAQNAAATTLLLLSYVGSN